MRRFLLGLAVLAIAAPLAHANDDRIAQQIIKSLKADQAQGNLKHFNIGLQVRDGDVFLSGHVANGEQEQLAIETARSADGVGQVVSEIEVRDKDQTRLVKRPQAGQRPAPAPLPTVDFATLQEDDELKDIDTEPEVRQTALEKDASEEQTNTEPLASAKAIATEIIDRFRKEKASGNLRGFGIDVEVDRGVVWLKGRVSSDEQQILALQIARVVPGVKKVVNELRVVAAKPRIETPPAPAVQPRPVPTEDRSDEIARVVVRRLQEQKKKGNLQDFGIDVHVDQGVVWLSGYVKNMGQQLLALDMARFVPGVKKVVNDLSIRPPEQRETTSSSEAEPAELNAETILSTAATESLAETAEEAPAPKPLTRTIEGQRYTLVPAHDLVGQVAPNQTPLAFAPARPVNHSQVLNQASPAPIQMGAPGVGIAPARFDHPQMPGYAWPSYAPHPNYGAVTYPKQYSASAWPYIGPFYPYPQVPLGWRKVTLEWDDGWWHLDFKNRHH